MNRLKRFRAFPVGFQITFDHCTLSTMFGSSHYCENKTMEFERTDEENHTEAPVQSDNCEILIRTTDEKNITHLAVKDVEEVTVSNLGGVRGFVPFHNWRKYLKWCEEYSRKMNSGAAK